MATNLWDLFTDPRTAGERRVERDMESAVSAATASQLSASAAVQQQVAELRGQVHDLSKSVARLSAMVSVLAQGLGQAKAYDERWAREELQRLLNLIDPPPAPRDLVPATAPSGSPYRGPTPKPRAKQKAPAVRTVACAACQAQVDSATTTFTAEGAVCDPCSKRIELEKLARGEAG